MSAEQNITALSYAIREVAQKAPDSSRRSSRDIESGGFSPDSIYIGFLPITGFHNITHAAISPNYIGGDAALFLLHNPRIDGPQGNYFRVQQTDPTTGQPIDRYTDQYSITDAIFLDSYAGEPIYFQGLHTVNLADLAPLTDDKVEATLTQRYHMPHMVENIMQALANYRRGDVTFIEVRKDQQPTAGNKHILSAESMTRNLPYFSGMTERILSQIEQYLMSAS